MAGVRGGGAGVVPAVVLAMQSRAAHWRWPLLLRWPKVSDILWVKADAVNWNQLIIRVWWN